VKTACSAAHAPKRAIERMHHPACTETLRSYTAYTATINHYISISCKDFFFFFFLFFLIKPLAKNATLSLAQRPRCGPCKSRFAPVDRPRPSARAPSRAAQPLHCARARHKRYCTPFSTPISARLVISLRVSLSRRPSASLIVVLVVPVVLDVDLSVSTFLDATLCRLPRGDQEALAWQGRSSFLLYFGTAASHSPVLYHQELCHG
jgi:hypothetical protein